MRRNFENAIGAYTGRLLEEEVFGRPKIPEEIKFMSFKKATDAVKEMQMGDPSDPDKRFANDLHALVADKLGLQDYSRLKFYSAVGTPLDIFHGVDALLELQLKKGRIDACTLDVSRDDQKETCKADVLIKMPKDGLDPKEDKKEYRQKLEQTADEVVRYFKQRENYYN
ncbi:hypothetical protein KKB69_01060 [Patescibacteria group bacterium]|nr:hypothetical protein [Patescibacteria group bacterium]